MVSIEVWRDRHPRYNDRATLEGLRAQYPERQVWVGDGPEQQLVEPVTPQYFFEGLLAIGHGAFKDRPILPSSVLLQSSADIAVYALGRSIKDPEDAAGALLERPLMPHAIGFLERMLELVEEAHESGVRTDTLTSLIDKRVPHFLQLAVKISNRVGDSVSTEQFCTMIWQEAAELSGNLSND